MTYNLNWTSSQTFGTFLKQVSGTSGYFELLLFFEFILLVIIGSGLNKRSTGITNVDTWLQLSSFVTTFSAGLLYLGGFISMITLTICLVITILLFIFTELSEKLFA